jgi:hypothetical protein
MQSIARSQAEMVLVEQSGRRLEMVGSYRQ